MTGHILVSEYFLCFIYLKESMLLVCIFFFVHNPV